MDGFEEGVPVPEVCTGQQAEAPHVKGGHVREDIPKHILDQDHVVPLRPAQDIQAERIDEGVVDVNPLAHSD